MSHSADRNLLFGILALQLNFVTRDQLIEGMHKWVLNKQKPLGEIFVDDRAMALDQRTLLEALVDKHVEKHGGDVHKSIQQLSSVDPHAAQQLAQFEDSGLEATMLLISAQSVDQSATQTFAQTPSHRFQIIRPYRCGGLGEVFIARDTELSRNVALKQIQEKHADDSDARQRFLREAEITGRLEHPGIVPVYGLGSYDNGRPFYAMKFVKGDSLKDAIDKFHSNPSLKTATSYRTGPLAVQFRDLLRRFVDVCHAIHFAHSRGILHRDLKPGNIMLGEYGETLVVDWGLAKTLGFQPEGVEESGDSIIQPAVGSVATMQGSAVGTPAYMSPEQAAGELALLGPETDVYSLGATLYHILVGKPPYQLQGKLAMLIEAVQQGNFTQPRLIQSAIDPEIEAICLKAMAKDQSNRYRTAQALAEDVEAYLADERIRESMERQAILVKEASIALFNHGVSDYERGFFDSAFENVLRAWKLLGDDDPIKNLYWSYLCDCATRGKRNRLSIQINSAISFFAFNPCDNGIAVLSSGTKAWLLETATGNRIGIPMDHEAAINAVAFSPDGSLIGTASDDNTARLWCAHTGQSRGRPLQHEGKVTSVAFSADGIWVATGSSDHTARIWEALTGNPRGSPLMHEGEVDKVIFHPNRNQLATTSLGKDIWCIWNLNTSKCMFAAKSFCKCSYKDLIFSPDGETIAVTSFSSSTIYYDAWNGETICAPMHENSSGAGFSPDGSQFAVVTESKLYFFDGRTGVPLGSLSHAKNYSVGFSFSRDSKLIVTWSGVTVRLWSAKTYESIGFPLIQENEIRSATFNADASEIAIQSIDRINIWKVVLPRTAKLDKRARNLFFSSDGSRIVTTDEKTVQLWDSKTLSRVGNPLQHLKNKSEIAEHWQGDSANFWHHHSQIHLSSDGETIVTSCGKRMTVFDVTSGRVLRERVSVGLISKVAISPNGQLIVFVEDLFSLTSWDLSTGIAITIPDAHEFHQAINHLDFRPDGKVVASCSDDRTARLWDAFTGKPIGNSMRHPDSVVYVAFSPGGNRIVTACRDNSARLWDPLTGTSIGDLMSHCVSSTLNGTPILWDESRINPICSTQFDFSITMDTIFSAHSSRAVSRHDEAVHIWDTNTHARLGSAKLTENELAKGLKFGISGNGCRVFIESNGQIRVLDANTQKNISEISVKLEPDPDFNIEIYADWFLDATVAEVGGLVASVSMNGVRLWDVNTGEAFGEPLPNEGLGSPKFSPDGRFLALGFDCPLVIWDVFNAKQLLIAQHTDVFLSKCFSPDATLLLTSSLDSTVRIWDVYAGTEKNVPMINRTKVSGLAFSPDSNQLVTAFAKQAQFWDVHTGLPIGAAIELKNDINSVTFINKTCIVTTVSAKKEPELWAVRLDEQFAQLMRITESNLYDLYCHANLHATITGNYVTIWSLPGVPLLAPFVHDNPVVIVAISSDGKSLATVTENRELHTWELDFSVPKVPTEWLDELNTSSEPRSSLMSNPSFQTEVFGRHQQSKFAEQVMYDPNTSQHRSVGTNEEQLIERVPGYLGDLPSDIASYRRTLGLSVLQCWFEIVNIDFAASKEYEESDYRFALFRESYSTSEFPPPNWDSEGSPFIINWLDFAEASLPAEEQMTFRNRTTELPTLERVRDIVTRLAEIDGYSVAWSIVLGAVQYRLGRFEQAVTVLSQALLRIEESDSSDVVGKTPRFCKPLAHGLLAIAFRELGDLPKFRKNCQSVHRTIGDASTPTPKWLVALSLLHVDSSRRTTDLRSTLIAALKIATCVVIVQGLITLYVSPSTWLTLILVSVVVWFSILFYGTLIYMTESSTRADGR